MYSLSLLFCPFQSASLFKHTAMAMVFILVGAIFRDFSVTEIGLISSEAKIFWMEKGGCKVVVE